MGRDQSTQGSDERVEGQQNPLIHQGAEPDDVEDGNVEADNLVTIVEPDGSPSPRAGRPNKRGDQRQDRARLDHPRLDRGTGSARTTTSKRKGATMRIESSVTSISWIPSESIEGMTRLPFEFGMAHYDEPPPEVLKDLEQLRLADRLRFANELRAYIEVEDGRIVGHGHLGSGHIGSTTLRIGRGEATLAAIPLPDLRPEPEVAKDRVRFLQTTGGRTGTPTPRRVRKPPFIQILSPLAWTTLALTIHTDGSSEHEVSGASPFPRHWIYDNSGALAAKSGIIRFDNWYREAFGKHSPWGDEDSPALVTQAESALERELSSTIMRGGKAPQRRNYAEGNAVVEQGEQGDEMFLLLDGVLDVEVDGESIAQVGPGAILGERALLEGGNRTATLRASTPCRVAVIPPDAIEPSVLEELRERHRREEA